jgi:molybdopterin synthase sulfur carrier subunit
MATAVIPSLLRGMTGGRERVSVSGRNLREVIDDLERQFPGIRERLIEGDDLNPSTAVAIDGEIATAGLIEPVGLESEIHFLPALGGGC